MSRNLLIYPLYKINGKETEYQKHKKFVDKNIEIVKKFDCVDDIIVLGKEQHRIYGVKETEKQNLELQQSTD